MHARKNLFVPGKRDYITGKNRPNVECILCSIIRGEPEVGNLLVWKNERVTVSANLYPYNSGHLLIFPKRHIVDIRELDEKEVRELFEITCRSLDILQKTYDPSGFNVGMNMGDASGASIAHLHQHVVPRYPKEMGFLDVISGEKIIIEDPVVTMKKLRASFQEALGTKL